jgi:hypothetical protein
VPAQRRRMVSRGCARARAHPNHFTVRMPAQMPSQLQISTSSSQLRAARRPPCVSAHSRCRAGSRCAGAALAYCAADRAGSANTAWMHMHV